MASLSSEAPLEAAESQSEGEAKAKASEAVVKRVPPPRPTAMPNLTAKQNRRSAESDGGQRLSGIEGDSGSKSSAESAAKHANADLEERLKRVEESIARDRNSVTLRSSHVESRSGSETGSADETAAKGDHKSAQRSSIGKLRSLLGFKSTGGSRHKTRQSVPDSELTLNTNRHENDASPATSPIDVDGRGKRESPSEADLRELRETSDSLSQRVTLLEQEVEVAQAERQRLREDIDWIVRLLDIKTGREQTT